jgi:hypothetical protein
MLPVRPRNCSRLAHRSLQVWDCLSSAAPVHACRRLYELRVWPITTFFRKSVARRQRSHLTRGEAMHADIKACDAKSEGAGRTSVETARPNFWTSLLRGRHPSQPNATCEPNEAAVADEPAMTPSVHEPRIIKQGDFDWGSFSAFEDGSIEVERNGVRQWFRTFSELKSSLSQTAENRRMAGGGLIDA